MVAVIHGSYWPTSWADIARSTRGSALIGPGPISRRGGGSIWRGRHGHTVVKRLFHRCFARQRPVGPPSCRPQPWSGRSTSIGVAAHDRAGDPAAVAQPVVRRDRVAVGQPGGLDPEVDAGVVDREVGVGARPRSGPCGASPTRSAVLRDIQRLTVAQGDAAAAGLLGDGAEADLQAGHAAPGLLEVAVAALLLLGGRGGVVADDDVDDARRAAPARAPRGCRRRGSAGST